MNDLAAMPEMLRVVLGMTLLVLSVAWFFAPIMIWHHIGKTNAQLRKMLALMEKQHAGNDASSADFLARR